MQDSPINDHREVVRLLKARDWSAAQSACSQLIAQYPEFAAGWFTASQISMSHKATSRALEAIDRAVALEPANANYRIHRGHCLLSLGRRSDALIEAEAAAACARDAEAWDAIGALRSYASDQPGALAAFDRAVALAPDNAPFIFNRASVRRFLGDLEGAEADYDRVIALRPADFEAHLNRSELRVQTPARNHVAELEAATLRAAADWRGEVQIRFALAKELEDVGEYARSFEHLKSGAKMRREHLQYDVGTDVATVDWISKAFPTGAAGALPDSSEDDPIFIVGLPRSGTTLVERILGSHSKIGSAGELDCFAHSLVAAAGKRAGRAQIPRQELVALSATLDFAALGKDYLRRAREVFRGPGRFIDKMPLNYLYCGLIRRALPRARIIHVTRHPMAICYAMFKTLFKSGYPFSYDLSDIARYYAAYRRLMSHWQGTMPGAVFDLGYEELIADQVGGTRKLLEYCGLEWEDECVAFHQNPAPTTTASASQVRRPIYGSSVAQWRHYETQLGDLKARLMAEGMEI